MIENTVSEAWVLVEGQEGWVEKVRQMLSNIVDPNTPRGKVTLPGDPVHATPGAIRPAFVEEFLYQTLTHRALKLRLLCEICFGKRNRAFALESADASYGELPVLFPLSC